VIGIGGPPDPAFAKELGARLFVRSAITLLSGKVVVTLVPGREPGPDH
jgi:hypothetical protein